MEWAPYFIAGAIMYLIYKEGFSSKKFLILVLTYFLAIKNAISHIPDMQNYYHNTFSLGIIIGIISAFYFIFLLLAFNKTQFLRKKKMILVGLITYPLYLIHQNIGIMLLEKLSFIQNPTFLFLGVILAMIGLAYLIHLFVEKKLGLLLKKFNGD